MNSKSFLHVVFFCLIVMGISCENDRTPEMIVGTWKLNQAMRNDRITNSLEGMYMNFPNDKSFDSNILGDSSSFSALVGSGHIKVDHDLIRFFEIKELTDSTMKLQLEINDDKLLLVFNR